jgi:hypothetical protein
MEKNKQQSAVEYLIEQYNLYRPGQMPHAHFSEVREKAKQMEAEQNKVTEDTSDGYHTFKELYEIRKAYNVALFNEWAKHWYIRDKQIKEGRMVPANVVFVEYNVHKSWRHHDGELCFGGGWFIVCANLPSGQISNHYKAEDWDLFKIPETQKALFPFDGHTTQDVINRLINL